jgi:hypothetical protein
LIILGLDPSLRQFGWAIHDTVNGGCLKRGRFTTTPKTVFVDRYIQLREDLFSLIQEEQPDRVGIEYPIFNDLWSEGMYGIFLYSCEALRLAQKDVVFFTPLQVKSHAKHFLKRPTGWKMTKGDMVKAAKVETGTKGYWNHNEADAYWVSRTAGRFWMLFEEEISEEDLTPPEKTQFLKIHRYQRGKKAGRVEKRGIMFREDDRFFLWSIGEEDGDEKEGAGREA